MKIKLYNIKNLYFKLNFKNKKFRLSISLILLVILFLPSEHIAWKKYVKGQANFEEETFISQPTSSSVPGEILIKFTSQTSQETINNTLNQLGGVLVTANDLDINRAQLTNLSKPLGQTLQTLNSNENVLYAELNYYICAAFVPNDPYYSYQWHFNNPTYDGIQLESAWDITQGKSQVIVAVLDTGVAYENYQSYALAPDLAQTHFVAGYDFINHDNHPNDDNGHGTHVAGVIAQSTNNHLGTAGIAPRVSIMPVKVLDEQGIGDYGTLLDGIIWATSHGADIINLSLSGDMDSMALKQAILYAHQAGVTIIAAAGNKGDYSLKYPAAYNEFVIAVGATRYDEQVAYYSNKGNFVDLVAPGGDLNMDQNNDGYGDGVLQQTFIKYNPSNFAYIFYQGTSMSTAHVTGVTALLFSEKTYTPNEVQYILQKSADDLGPPGWDDQYGWGLINASAALNYGAINQIVLTKSSNLSSAFPNQEITYTIHYHNTSQSPANNVTIKDLIPSGTTYVQGSANANPTATKFEYLPNNTLSWKYDIINANEEGDLEFKVKVN